MIIQSKFMIKWHVLFLRTNLRLYLSCHVSTSANGVGRGRKYRGFCHWMLIFFFYLF